MISLRIPIIPGLGRELRSCPSGVDVALQSAKNYGPLGHPQPILDPVRCHAPKNPGSSISLLIATASSLKLSIQSLSMVQVLFSPRHDCRSTYTSEIPDNDAWSQTGLNTLTCRKLIMQAGWIDFIRNYATPELQSRGLFPIEIAVLKSLFLDTPQPHHHASEITRTRHHLWRLIFSELQICHADIWSLPEGLLGVFFMGWFPHEKELLSPTTGNCY